MGWPAGIAITSAALAVTLAAAQNRPEFEVASVKASGPGSPAAGGCMPLAVGCRRGNLWSANNVRVRWLVQDAYEMSDPQIIGLPGWVDGARFDVEAKVAPEVSDAQFRLMERSLLESRFHLVAHLTTRELPAYRVDVAKSGLKLQPPGAPCAKRRPGFAPQPDTADPLPPCGPQGLIAERGKDGRLTGSEMLVFNGITMRELLADLEFRFAGGELPIVDQTGYSGVFDLKLTFFANPPAGRDRPAQDDYDKERVAAVEEALRKELGLELNLHQPTRLQVPALVVENISLPSAN